MDMGKVVLDDKVADDVALSDTLACRIVIKRFEPAFAKAVAAWQFVAGEGNLVWDGRIAGPDRLRFLGMISRYSALVSDISLTENAA
jgi:ABC-2 type transport system ATP-binding protein